MKSEEQNETETSFQEPCEKRQRTEIESPELNAKSNQAQLIAEKDEIIEKLKRKNATLEKTNKNLERNSNLLAQLFNEPTVREFISHKY